MSDTTPEEDDALPDDERKLEPLKESRQRLLVRIALLDIGKREARNRKEPQNPPYEQRHPENLPLVVREVAQRRDLEAEVSRAPLNRPESTQEVHPEQPPTQQERFNRAESRQRRAPPRQNLQTQLNKLADGNCRRDAQRALEHRVLVRQQLEVGLLAHGLHQRRGPLQRRAAAVRRHHDEAGQDDEHGHCNREDHRLGAALARDDAADEREVLQRLPREDPRGAAEGQHDAHDGRVDHEHAQRLHEGHGDDGAHVLAQHGAHVEEEAPEDGQRLQHHVHEEEGHDGARALHAAEDELGQRHEQQPQRRLPAQNALEVAPPPQHQLRGAEGLELASLHSIASIAAAALAALALLWGRLGGAEVEADGSFPGERRRRLRLRERRGRRTTVNAPADCGRACTAGCRLKVDVAGAGDAKMAQLGGAFEAA
ncbi:hypothetical protein ON010_g39 [Phytophthora cinnamomi]|nr:hypothetical protein ON010_g39 [Phytophthora cinnamomi]